MSMSLLSQVARTMAEERWSVRRAVDVLESFDIANRTNKDGDELKISIEEINAYFKEYGGTTDDHDISDALFRPSTSYMGCGGSETQYAITSIDILDSNSTVASLTLFLRSEEFPDDYETVLMEQLQRTEHEYYRYLNPTEEELAARRATAIQEIERRRREERDETGTTYVRSDGTVVQK